MRAHPPEGRLNEGRLTVGALFRTFPRAVAFTWILTLGETALMALIPLLIGFAIDDLLAGGTTALFQLAGALAGLVALGVLRRLYDTRVYSRIRVRLGEALASRSADVPVSSLTARLGMSRELVAFLEEQAPAVMTSAAQLVISLVVLYTFHPALSGGALVSAVAMLALYGCFHRRFFRLYREYNQESEQQVALLERRAPEGILGHLQRLRSAEVRISDSESILYGGIFTVLLGFIVYNLWFAATNLEATVGSIFSIVTYSWEFVESALVMPATLQGWSRLSEIEARINGEADA